MTGILILIAMLFGVIIGLTLSDNETDVKDVKQQLINMENRVEDLEYGMEMTDDVHNDLEEKLNEDISRVAGICMNNVDVSCLLADKLGYEVMISSNGDARLDKLTKVKSTNTKKDETTKVKSTKKTSKK